MLRSARLLRHRQMKGDAASAALRPQPDDHVDMGNLHALRRLGQIAHADVAERNVAYVVLALDEEVMMVRDVGVEICLRRFHGQDPQQPRFGELVKRVVDRRERHRHACGGRLLVQFLRGEVPVALGEEQMGKGDTLSRGAQSGRAQAIADFAYAPRPQTLLDLHTVQRAPPSR